MGETTRWEPDFWRSGQIYFWTEGCEEGDSEYHWLPVCSWLATSLARGGRLVIDTAPPPDASEAERDSRSGETDHHAGYDRQANTTRSLCLVCATFLPPRVEPSESDQDACATCGCSRTLHEGPLVGIFNHGCVTEYTWVVQNGPEPGDVQVALLHCRCDGYRPAGTDRTLLSILEAWFSHRGPSSSPVIEDFPFDFDPDEPT